MFAKRNAVIAALSSAVVVAEAPAGSGALISARDALRLGRPVFAVPGPVGARASEGTNDLLASGQGRVCLRADDVARAIGLTAAPAIAIQDPILDALAAGPLDLDALAARMRLPRTALRMRLVARVLAGAVADRGDGRFGRGPVS
jgi:DNA processing protein